MYLGEMSKHDAVVSGNYKSGRKLPFTIGDRYMVRSTASNGNVYIVAFNKKTPILSVCLYGRSWHGFKYYAVSSAYVKYSYQGNGLCKELYKKLIIKYKISLLTTGSHSEGACKTWLRVSEDPLVNAYGFSFKTDRVWALGPNRDKTKLVGANGNHKLYGNEYTGIILTKADHIIDKTLSTVASSKTKLMVKKDMFNNGIFNQFSTEYI